MKNKRYEAPEAEIITVKTEDVIMVSGTLRTFSGDKLLSLGKILDIE